MHCQLNSRRQLLDCLDNGLVEVPRSFSVQSPVKDSTGISAGQPKFDVVHFVNHRVLRTLTSNRPTRTRGTHSDVCEENTDGAKNGLG